MARYKKIYLDEQHELDKKRNRISTAVSYVVCGLWLALLILAGCYQHNGTVVGCCLLAYGLINIGYACFAFGIRRKWKIMTVYDSDELYRERHLFAESSKQLAAEIRVKQWLVDGIIVLSVPVCVVLGLCKLLGV